MTKNILKVTITLIALASIISCIPGRDVRISTICESHPELCSNLHKIGDCRYLRTSLIRARYYNKVEPNQTHTRDLLAELDAYESCLELTLFLQYTRHKERKQLRFENYTETQNMMKSLLVKSKGTQDPHLAYYLWTRHQDLNAKAVFLNAAQRNDLKDSKLLTKLATIYSKTNSQYSLELFYRALKESNSLDDLPTNIFTLIMTTFYQNRQFEQAYIWALIAKEECNDKELPINLELILQKGLRSGKKQITNEDALEETAEHYIDLLEDGLFNIPAPQLKN